MAKQVPESNIPEKKAGLAHFFAAATYSWGGFKFMTGEVPFRHELSALAALLVILYFAGASALSFILVLAFGLATLAVECLNSAIELIVDKTSPEISDYAKNAKDVGSFAVFCMMLATGIIALHGVLTAL